MTVVWSCNEWDRLEGQGVTVKRPETFSYRAMIVDYLRSGARWYSAPRPMLLDSLFDVDRDKPAPRNDEPAFDAANVLRPGLMLCNPAQVEARQNAGWRVPLHHPGYTPGRHNAELLQLKTPLWPSLSQ